MTYDQILHNLRNNINFSFSRWGDGEWTAALRLKLGHKSNCDGHQYFEDMGRELHRILESKPKYYMGLQPLAKRLMNDKIGPYLDGIDWCDADVLHKASQQGQLDMFIDALKGRNVGYVGSDDRIAAKFGWAFTRIPDQNCWLRVDETLDCIRSGLSYQKDAVILFSASMAANVMVDRLYQGCGITHTFIDVGSVFDPYVGKATRKYHTQIIDREHKRSNPVS